MKINYNVSSRKVISKSSLTPCSPSEALFYVDKGDVSSFEMSFSDTFDFSSKIYKIDNLKKVVKVQANTTNILFTNVYIDGVPYFYEVISSDGSLINATDVLLNSEYNVSLLNGKLYTNDLITNYEITDGTFIYSSPVVCSSSVSIKYNDRFIQLTIPKEGEVNYTAKVSTKTVTDIEKISEYKIAFPSFYLEKRGTIYKVVEGDLLTFTKKEVLNTSYNVLNPKDKVVELLGETDAYVDRSNNTILLKEAYLVSKEIVVEYLAKTSSLQYEVDDKLFLKVTKQGLQVSNEEEADIIIRRIVQSSSLRILPNDYLKKYKYKLRPKEFSITLQNREDSCTKDFSKKILIKTIKDAGMFTYVKLHGKTIKQRQYIEQAIPVVTLESLEDYLEESYEYPLLEESNEVFLKSTNTLFKVEANAD